MADANSSHGRELIEKVFSPTQLAEFIEIKKKSKVQNDNSQTIEIYNKESFSTQSETGQDALIQSKVFDQATNIMACSIEDMDAEIEQKGIKKQFLENKIGLPVSEIFEEMN